MNHPEKPKLSRNVLALGFVSLLTDASTEIVYPFLPFFLTALGASVAFIGLVEGIAETTASLLKLVAGRVSDRLRARKRLILFGYGLSGLTRPLMAVAFAPIHVLLVRFFDRVGKGFRGAPRDALIADATDPEIRGKAFGFHRAMDHLGAVIGPLIAFALLASFHQDGGKTVPASTYRLIFWVAAIPAALAVLTLIIFVQEIPPAEAGPQKNQASPFTLSPFDSRFKGFLGVMAVFTLGNSSDAFLLLRASELGIVTAQVPLLWVTLHIVKSAASVPGSALSDRIGRRWTIRIGWAVYATIYAGFACATATWHVWALFAAYGIYFGLTEGSEKAYIADLVPSNLRGTAYGIHGFTVGIAALPASVLFGLFWSSYGSSTAFLFGAGVSIVASALLTVLPALKAKGATDAIT